METLPKYVEFPFFLGCFHGFVKGLTKKIICTFALTDMELCSGFHWALCNWMVGLVGFEPISYPMGARMEEFRKSTLWYETAMIYANPNLECLNPHPPSSSRAHTLPVFIPNRSSLLNTH